VQPDGNSVKGFRLRRDGQGLCVQPYFRDLPGRPNGAYGPAVQGPEGRLTLGVARPTPSTFRFYYRRPNGAEHEIETLTVDQLAHAQSLFIGAQCWCYVKQFDYPISAWRIERLEGKGRGAEDR
jgi:hypothetical protein